MTERRQSEDLAPVELSTLFIRGKIPDGKRRVGIVGARAASAYGVHWARALSTALARAGFVVVSGGARGIDIAAHRAALAAGGETIAALATGLDVAYPRDHVRDFEAIAAHGALVTEYPLGTTPRPHHFQARNRIIAALAEAIVVVEGGLRSGSLITARHARAMGRRVFALPGDVGSPLAAAPHHLIATGASIVESCDALVAELDSTPRPALSPEPSDAVTAALARGADTAEALAAAMGRTAQEVSILLSAREVAGQVRRISGGRYELVAQQPVS